MKRILILGATSAIAEAVARLYAQRSDALFLAGRDTERLGQIVRENIDMSARVADQVVMRLLVQQLVPALAAAQVRFGEDADVPQALERAVDGGPIDVGHNGLDPRDDLVRSHVLAGMKDAEHEDALRRRPLSSRARGR